MTRRPSHPLITFFISVIIFLLCCPGGSIKCQVSQGLLASYSFNNANATDDLGKLHGKVYNVDFEEDRFGNPGKAAYFRGNLKSFINLGTSSLLKPKQGSISLWLNCQGLLAFGKGFEANPFLWTRSNASQQCNSAYVMGLDLNTQKFNAGTIDSCEKGISTYAKTMAKMGRWYHLVMTYDNNYLKLYVNGELQHAVDKKFESRFLEGDSVNLGVYNDGKNQRSFLGKLDDIAFFNRALSPEEVTLLYNAPNPDAFKEYLQYAKIVLLVLLLTTGLALGIRYYIKYSIRKAGEKTQLLNHANEQEIKVLKAQMNPHFIFNALNSIQQFIVTEENEKAQLYLSKFSRLLRKILESNTGDSIQLKDEIEILIGYLEIESLRFNDVFDYTVKMSDSLKGLKVGIPNFLIQPFVENAVWHGLLPKEKDRRLFILFDKQDDRTLRCVIDDNGVGRKTKTTEKPGNKGKSLAIDFIKQRLDLLSKVHGRKYSVNINDRQNEQGESQGTEVVLTIPILND